MLRIRFGVTCFLLLLFMSVSVTRAFATAYYVDSTSGNDTNTGTAQSTPWRTLTKISSEFAAGNFAPGDNILLKRGSVWTVTTDQVTALKLSGSSGVSGQPITIADYGTGAVPKIVSSGMTSNINNYVVGRFSSDPRADHITLKNLEIQGSGGRRQILMANVTNWTLDNIYAHGAERYIDPADPSGTSVASVQPQNNSRRIIIKNSRIEDSEGEGLKAASVNSLTDLTGEMVIINTTFRNNAYEGIDFRDGLTNTFIYNSVIINNGDGGGNTGDTVQISVGGQKNYFFRCRVEGADTGNITAVRLGRYGEDDTYSGRYNTFERCLFKNTTGSRTITFEHNNNQVLNSTFVNVSPNILQCSPINSVCSTINGKFQYNIFDQYVGNMFTINGGSTTIDRNGFSDATQGQRPIQGNPSFANTTTYDLTSNSPFRNQSDNGEDLGWEEFGWTETNYRNEFLANVRANYAADLANFVEAALLSVTPTPTPSPAASPSPSLTPDAVITINRNQTSTSSFSLGLTHVDSSLQSGNAAALTSARGVVTNTTSYQNNHIMAWGVEDPWPNPASTEPTNWGQLDARVQLTRDLGSIPMITLMNAPWWMKGQLTSQNQPGGTTTKLIPDVQGEWDNHTYGTSFTDYRGINYPAGYVSPDPYAARVLDNQMDKWLHLVQRTAERYMIAPYNVRHFQVWNEMKGYYNPSINRWDHTTSAGDATGYNAKHGYTYMYNQVYQVLRNVATAKGIDPNTIKIGGPYPVVATLSVSGAGGFPTTEPLLQNKPYGYFDQRDLDVVKYWLQNKVGGQFIAIDMKNRNKPNPGSTEPFSTLTDPFTSNNTFADVVTWIRSLNNSTYPGATTLPIFFSEWYSTPHNTTNPAFNNAVKTDAIIKLIPVSGDKGVTPLMWGGQESQTVQINQSLYTATSMTGGGQGLPWSTTAQALKTYFSPGTTIYETTSSSPDITALAGQSKTVLVNKTNTNKTIQVGATTILLNPYEVKIVDTESSSPTPQPSYYELVSGWLLSSFDLTDDGKVNTQDFAELIP